MHISDAKNCPFCEDSDVGMYKQKDGKCYVECFECEANGPIASCESEAVEKWNDLGQPPKIKNCPFCGSKASFHDGNKYNKYVVCNNTLTCHAIGPNALTKEMAIIKWNACKR